MLIAQLTDTHITVPQNKNENCYVKLEALQKCVLQINDLDTLPDVVIHTGDLCHNGHKDEYKLAKSVMDELKVPYFVTAGNRGRFFGTWHFDESVLRVRTQICSLLLLQVNYIL